jgi:membrane-associated protease RseP (regulator of RpoE activity)
MVWVMGVLLALGLLPKYTFRLYPVLGLYLLVYNIKDLMFNTANTANLTGSVISAIKSTTQHSSSISESLYLGGVISVALGIINCIPILPSDGGRIIERILCSISYQYRKLIVGIYRLTIIPVLILIILALL